ncbi:T9SS type A sorting domain-containing protein [Empedobacter sp. UBA7248]|uniref:T9SS type A sorting domain-containing protein n=1 Tax=Empedobacter sp. UBA7248 TaxID=1946448 RepID=UPI0025BD24C9|nr:T9SS type A sorting domain-containing protein [Empedobacter sp. UBA7248]
MKKNLLALFVLGAIYSASAQDTYIKDAVIVKVNPNTLFYNGGNVNVSTDQITATTEKIINQGNIQIQGGFTNVNETGKNFVNKYTSSTSYGQLIIKDASSVTGKVAIERSVPDLTNDEYIISLPYKNTSAKDVINSMTGGDFFSGNCAINVDCGLNKRYNQSLFVWDVEETEYDAVDNNYTITPERRYLLNLRNGTNVKSTINSLGAVSSLVFAGIPNNNQTNYTLKSGLKGKTSDFANLAWKDWKNRINNYAESYDSYIGNQTGTKYDNDKLFGKNLHRLGNPFTSNLDLSNINSGASWITFNTASGSGKSPAEAWLALRFRVFKVANDYIIKWNSNSGNTSTGNTTALSAYLMKDNTNSKYFWTGSPEALLVKPYESFYVDYNVISPSGNGSLIIDAKVNLSDSQKTFINGYTFSGTGTYSKSANTANVESDILYNEKLKENGLVTDFDFTQLELYLSKDNQLQGNAAYLLNANFMVTGSSNPAKITNPIFFYEEDKEGNVLLDSQTLTNQFNNEDYIGKPLRIGFYNLENGKNYRLNLNLYEYSILNKVKNLTVGKYYLYDNVTKKAIDVSEATELSFIADDKINERFEFYWNELPSKLGTSDLNRTDATFLYTNNKSQYVRFEDKNTTADISIFDLTGRQIFYKTNIMTNTDYKLNLANIPTMYVVKITYKDGKVVTKKTINK